MVCLIPYPILSTRNRLIEYSDSVQKMTYSVQRCPSATKGKWREIVWRGPEKKICRKYMILGASGAIWSDLGIFWSDLECRITVCNFSVELSIQKSQPSNIICLLGCYSFWAWIEYRFSHSLLCCYSVGSVINQHFSHF